VLQSQSARRFNSTLSFGLVMNLVAALGSGERDLIWRYLVHYDPAIEGDADTMKLTRELMECALNFYRDFIEPAKFHYTPSDGEREQLRALSAWLAQNGEAGAEDIEKAIYELGRQHYDKPGKIFPLLYRVILGQERGPRLGAFIRLTTPARVAEIVDARLD
jgi:lysyl-tRNA synthetase class 1